MRTLPASRSPHRVNWRWVVRTASILLILGVLVAYAVLSAMAILDNWFFDDARGYWETGLRIRAGGDLYPPLADQDHAHVYRYAPWFAWAWTALTFLPEPVVLVGWGLLMAVASAWLLWQLPKTLVGLALALVFGPMLLRVVSQGNVQPLIVAFVAFGLWRRSGPGWIALAASLKIVPILFGALYVARGEYVRAAVTMVLTAILWLPALTHGVEHYPVAVGGDTYPFGLLPVFITVAALLAIIVAPTRFRPLLAALAVTFATPRWIPYNPTYLLAAVTRDRHAETDRAG